MPEYRRAFVPGGTFFLTVVTYRRKPLFAEERNVAMLRTALAAVKRERPFETLAVVVLPDHLHFVWELPPHDADFSTRVGRMKVLFTRAFRAADGGRCPAYSGRHPPGNAASRVKRREGDVWQRRFWEHTIRDEQDMERHVNYIHYNPVKHGLVPCPHLWRHSSFRQWVERGVYDDTWCCGCGSRRCPVPDFAEIEKQVGE